MVEPYFKDSILKRAKEKSLLNVRICALRDFGIGSHHTTDDLPYGGGPGMLLKPEPIFSALTAIRAQEEAVGNALRVIMPSPQGTLFNQEMALSFSKEEKTLVFICGRYEGIDARVAEGISLEEVSVGDYILTGGELPAMVMIDASARLIPGVLGEPKSLTEESFSVGNHGLAGTFEYPQYTRPAEFAGMKVPAVLLSGNHAEIAKWRKEKAFLNTQQRRPDLLM
jgi:tRNA (guanine37-N1)-methyltransferase